MFIHVYFFLHILKVTEKITFTKIAILDDGYLPRSRSSKLPLVQNTSGFDTACYVILCRMVDDDEFKKYVLSSMNETMSNFMNTYIKEGAHKNTYLARNSILMKLYKTESVDGIEVVNCNSTPLENIKRNYTENLPSAIVTCNCDRKKKSKNTVSVFKWHNDGEPFDSFNSFREFQCKKCDLNLSEINLGNLVFIDTNDRDMIFSEIPQAILLADRVCILYSIIQNIRQGQCITHIKRCNQAWYTFDNKIQKVSVAKFSGKKMSVHLLAFTCVSTTKSFNKNKCIKDNSKSFEVIQNFHTYSLNGIKVNVKNVCGPDALFHILSKIYSDNADIFEEKFKNTTLFSLISAFNLIDENAVYHHRTTLLLQKKISFSVQSFNEITIDCDSNIFNAIQMLTLDCLPSSKKNYECANCGIRARNITVLEINFKMLTGEGINALSSCISLQNEETISKCRDCGQEQKEYNTFSNIVFIDIQPMTTQDERFAMPKMKLKSLPLTIIVAKKSYHLKGVIEFQLNEFGLSHYIAHCYENGEWIAFDDLLRKQQKSSNDYLEPHVLVYTI